jgi:hypothetical protein
MYRLRKKMSRDDAIAFLEEEGGRLKPYRNYQDWDSAVRKAKAIIRNLEAGTFIVPPYEEGLHGRISEKFLKAARLR